MKRMVWLARGLAVCGLSLPLWANAQQTLLPAQSELLFVSKQMGVPVEGRFRQFDAQVVFDPAKLASSKVTFHVNMGSATLGVKEVDAELPKPVWFNTARFPQATFQSSTIQKLAADRYEIGGKLQIKGLVADLKVPVTLTQSAGTTWVTGQFPLRRLGFKIGDNEWADTSMVADEVTVKFKFALTGVGRL